MPRAARPPAPRAGCAGCARGAATPRRRGTAPGPSPARSPSRGSRDLEDGAGGPFSHPRLAEPLAQILEGEALIGRYIVILEETLGLGGETGTGHVGLEDLRHRGSTRHDVGEADPGNLLEEPAPHPGGSGNPIKKK